MITEDDVRKALASLGKPAEEVDEALRSWRLGNFIYEQNPYGDGLRVVGPLHLARPASASQTLEEFANSAAGHDSVEVDGLGWRFDEHHAFQNPVVTKFDAIMEGVFWYFRGKPNRIAKAVRIKYTYQGQPRDAENFLLIGFHGQGGE